jgi:hypothetical protein
VVCFGKGVCEAWACWKVGWFEYGCLDDDDGLGKW